jgi:MoxR-like ATPase
LPADILGVSLYNPETRQFAFRRGPIFSQVLLVDEINRATPRTQSALLEAMGETQVSVEGATLPLPDPFFVLATQNPVEFEGTFPLPEAQMDRFLISFALGYPDSDEELAVVEGQRLGHPIEKLAAVTEIAQAAALRDVVGEVFIERDLAAYIVRLVRATRFDPRLLLGASPRGSLALTRIAQAWAILQGRDYVIPDDVKTLAPFVLAHRLVLRAEARLKGYTAAKVLEEIVGGQDVPIAE